jgi:hypothetical protein
VSAGPGIDPDLDAVNDPWAELALADRHPDPVVAGLENDRDRYYARAEYDYAEQAHHQALDEAYRLEHELEVGG